MSQKSNASGESRRHPLATLMVVLAVLLWCIALLLPVVNTKGINGSYGTDQIDGLVAAMFGWWSHRGILAWLGQFLVLASTWGALRTDRSMGMRLLPAGLALATVAAGLLVLGAKLKDPEMGGLHDQITSYAVGYYVWALSLLLLACAPLVIRRSLRMPEGDSRE